MATAKKWSVTYTKHVKQKRKVYQDGFLTFDSSSNMVMLCDSSEKLLECRLLKSDEVVRCGETVMFNAYLVDVGDLEGGDRPFNGVSSYSCATHIDDIQNRHDKISSKENEKSKVDKSRAGTTALSPSQNVTRGTHLRGLKRREINKYGMLSKSPDSVPTTADWHVLYTAQLTQKTKKYHDGYLRFTNSGSLNIQVQLYDENWSLLDSRFMKKAEEVKPGKKMTFHAHVVEVVEPRGNHGNSTRSFQQLQVLYTAQVTKKAKMYQDGFLQLMIRRFLGRQITLYDESRRVLNNRFLEKDELIQSGKSIAFDGYLVDIGAPEGQGGIPVDLGNEEVVHGYDKTKKRFNFHKPVIRQSIQKGSINGPARKLSGWNLERTSSVGDCSSNAGISIVKEAEQTERSSMRKSLRDARQILSILGNPCSEEKGITPSSDANKGISDSSDNSTKPSSSSIEIVDFQASELAALGCTENQLAQTLHVQDIDKLCYDNESNAQGGWSDPTSSHPLRHSDEMSMFGPIKPDPEMCMEFPSFDLGF